MPSVMYVYVIVLACVLYGTVHGQEDDCAVMDCMTCAANDNETCTACDSSFYVDAGGCTACSEQNCVSCPADVCDNCDSGYDVSNNGTCEESSGGGGEGGASSLWTPSFGTFSVTAILTVVLVYQENILCKFTGA